MNKKQMILLLEILSDTSKSYNSKELAQILKMGVSTLKKDLVELNDILKSEGAFIEGKSGVGNGYKLKVTNEDQYNYFYNQQRLNESSVDLTNQSVRVEFLVKYLLENQDYVKSEKLAEMCFESTSQLSNDLKLVRKYLAQHDIKLVSKPHYGLKVECSEKKLRSCLKQILADEMDEQNIIDKDDDLLSVEFIKRIEDIVIEECEKFNYSLTAMTLNNLVVHLLVTCQRVKESQEIKLSQSIINEVSGREEFSLAIKIVQALQCDFDIQFSDSEVYYITLHLSSKRIVDKREVNEDAMELVKCMIEEINRCYEMDFSNNFNFQIMLATHLIPLIDRIRFKTKLYNPLIQEIRKNLLIAYEIALCCAQVIKQKYDYALSEDEVGYIALHIKVAINQTSIKRKILLVCATGHGSALLMRNNFERHFEKDIELLDTCDVVEIKEKDLTKYDAIFTTVPIDLGTNVVANPPIFLVKYFLDDYDIKQIQNQLDKGNEDMNLIINYFQNNLFFTDIKGKNSIEIIRNICNEIDKVYSLPHRFVDEVIKREELSQTHFGGIVAFPHPNGNMGTKTFISVSVLKTPVQWGDGKVQIVLLSSFEKGMIVKNRKLFDVITNIIINEKYTEMLVKNPSYEILKEIICKNF